MSNALVTRYFSIYCNTTIVGLKESEKPLLKSEGLLMKSKKSLITFDGVREASDEV